MLPKASLDLTEKCSFGQKHGSLYWLMDETKTAMGGRMLRSWLQRPLIDEARISPAAECRRGFLDHFFERSDLTESSKGVL